MIRYSLHWSIRLISTAQVRIYADWTGSTRLTDESGVADGPADAGDGESDGWNGDDATRQPGLSLGCTLGPVSGVTDAANFTGLVLGCNEAKFFK